MHALNKAASIDINIFSGAGGLALGLKGANAWPSRLYELDKHAWATCRQNGLAPTLPPGWEEHGGDVRKVEWREDKASVRILAAGVPCQPFSRGGKHEAQSDARNLFPEALRAIRDVRPQAIIIENVHGLLRPGFSQYRDYVLRCIEQPSLKKRDGERWQSHNVRLRKRQLSRGYEPEYTVACEALNAADYGVPQLRRRVFIVAVSAGTSFTFPTPTHSKGALVRTQASGDYWKRWGILPRIKHKKRDVPEDDFLLPWVTVRDTISSLGAPAEEEEEDATSVGAATPNHWSIPGAKRYDGHNGSDMDWPSKTIKAGVHGVPGGENTVRDGHRFRYYTLREAALIQTFPTDYAFSGARIHVTRQIGNAVPPLLASAVAKQVLNCIGSSQAHHELHSPAIVSRRGRKDHAA